MKNKFSMMTELTYYKTGIVTILTIMNKESIINFA